MFTIFLGTLCSGFLLWFHFLPFPGPTPSALISSPRLGECFDELKNVGIVNRCFVEVALMRS